MIKSLTLTDFQCHESLLVELDRVTVIIGRNGKGKSALIRAIRWLLTNQPSGDAAVRWGCESTKVRAVIDDHSIIRRKGKAVNTYRLDGEVYKNLKPGQVPDDIVNLLNVGPASFAGQHDGPFWFSLTPGQVSKELNAVVNLDVIDRTLADLSSRVRKAKAVVEVSKQRLRDARERRDGLSWVRNAVERFAGVERAYGKAEESTRRGRRLAQIAEEGFRAFKGLERLRGASTSLSRVLDAGSHTLAIRKRADDLSRRVGEAERLQAEAAELRRKATESERDLTKQLKGKCPVCGGKLG